MNIKFNRTLQQFQITADVYDLIWLANVAQETGQKHLTQASYDAIESAKQESERVADILQKEGWGE